MNNTNTNTNRVNIFQTNNDGKTALTLAFMNENKNRQEIIQIIKDRMIQDLDFMRPYLTDKNIKIIVDYI